MPLVQSYPHGAFCWCEEATTNQPVAKEFYKNVFGWTYDDMEYAPGEMYTMFALNDASVAGMATMESAQRNNGVPSHWKIYVSVDAVDEMTAKAAGLGATVLAPAFDVMDIGRMSVIQDPTGAVVYLWQKGTSIGASVVDEPGAFCWYELATKDTAAAATFYTALFGWKTAGSAEYTEWQLDGQSIGGMMNIPDVPPNWMPYITVADIDASTALAQQHGATALIGPADAGAHGRFCVLLDPTGAAIGIYQRK